MIGYFPPPYPDEILYSVCARYSDIVQYTNKRDVCFELFGSTNATAVVDFPKNLAHLAQILPKNNCFSIEQIINNHTLIPYYQPFLPIHRLNSIKLDLENGGISSFHFQTGKAASRVKSSIFLRFCPRCSREDLKKRNETYWRRLHQLDGVIVCHKHRTYLEESDIKMYCPSTNFEFFSANKSVLKTTKTRLLGNSSNDSLLLKISELSEQLLNLKFDSIGNDKLKENYLNLLLKNNFASYSFNIYANKFEKSFLDFFSVNFLTKLGCNLTQTGNNSKSNWIFNLVRKGGTAVQHPLHHILMMIFLDCDFDYFFNNANKLDFFGKPPWRCLNPAAEHYKQFVVEDFFLGLRCRNGKPVGIFKCYCGFEFARSGPDIRYEDKFRIDKIINFGVVWETKLKELWNSPNLNLSEISRRLNVDSLTIKRYAKKLGLSFDREFKSYKVIRDKDKLKEFTDKSNIIVKSRAKWIELRNQFPTTPLKILREQNSQIYNWLYNNDREWLKTKLPQKSVRQNKNNSSVNWKKRDILLSKLVKNAAEKLINNKDKPKRVTKTAIGKEANCLSLLQFKIDKLPKTKIVLSQICETHEQFASRRIIWKASYCQQNKDL